MMTAMKETIVEVTGMTCSACVRHVDAALRKLEGVGEVEVSLAGKTARILHDDATPSTEQITAAIVDAGYDAKIASRASVADGAGR